MTLRHKKIMITGGTGMVAHALQKLIPNATFVKSISYDLRNQSDVNDLFINVNPEYVIHLAAKVGGIKANANNLGTFYYDNVMMNTNLLEASRKYKVKKLISVLSTCIYPDNAIYPLTEGQIHYGPPHSSNYGYAHAKRMLDVQSRAYREQFGCNFITVVPNNLFGPGDNFDLEDSHVIPALIRKMFEAIQTDSDVVLWGDGSPLREFTYSEDFARILLFLLESYNDKDPINVGNTKEWKISQIADIIASFIGFTNNIVWDETQLTGQKKKPSCNNKLLNLGWSKENYTSFEEGIQKTCQWFLETYPNIRGIR